ncbi:MAG: hypothetical protein CMP22_03870 [Rickettsiales bacterium]|nr:hypothetical protein [Rickettsiales bacterium]|tara:strand:+ start:390 stop:686 length:297 start_codon:yes stop_codon:yes gene_type:complete
MMSEAKKLTWSDYFDLAPAILSINPDIDVHTIDDDELALLVRTIPNFDDENFLPQNDELLKRLRWLLIDQAGDDHDDVSLTILSEIYDPYPQTNKGDG